MTDLDLTRDHKRLDDDLAARRYFNKFALITRLLAGVAEEMQQGRSLSALDTEILGHYVGSIAASFRALSLKYLVSGRLGNVGARHLTIDLHESGFPIYQELVSMANDAAQAARHLEGMPQPETLRDEMVRHILSVQTVPTELQYAMSQRLYYEALARGDLFWPQMHPQAQWVSGGQDRRGYVLHWAVYDSQLNVPVLYLMDLEDSGRKALPLDERRWPSVQAHLLAQSVGGLKLVTIAKGFDTDFADLHPKRLRRIHLGPMYSHAFTLQTGPIRDVLAEAKSPPGEDWALAWTVEELESERVEQEKAGWFSSVEREVFRLDPFSGRGVDTGATRVGRSLILPQRPFQALAERDPEGFRAVRKFVVGSGGRVVVYG